MIAKYYICLLTAVMRTAKIISFCTLFMLLVPLQAQKKLFKGKPIEFGVTLGASNYMGDLSQSVAVQEFNPMGGLICRFNLSDWVTLRGNALFGQISGDDKNYADVDAFRKQRNLNFKSNIVEFGGTVEWNFRGFGETQTANPHSPFLFAGVAVFKYNPKTLFKYMPTDPNGQALHGSDLQKFDNQWIELQPLGTEGQETTKYNDRRRYPLTQISIPIGMGYKQHFNGVWAWGVELGVRKTFTDYLDDVSGLYPDYKTMVDKQGLASAQYSHAQTLNGQPFTPAGTMRGDEHFNDWFYFIGITASYRFTPLICR